MKRVTQPLLDALDIDYDIPCLGTALFSIQSGSTTTATQTPALTYKGVTSPARASSSLEKTSRPVKRSRCHISMIIPNLAERNESLRDYGFDVLACAFCEGERAAVFSCGRI